MSAGRSPSKPSIEAERAVIFSMLRRAGGQSSTRRRDSLYRQSSQSREEIDRAINRLAQAGVLQATAHTIRPTSALATLDELSVIAV